MIQALQWIKKISTWNRKTVRHTGRATVMHSALIRVVVWQKQPWKSSIPKDIIFFRAQIEFWIPIMSGWFKQPTLCCSIANKMSGGLWAQFVKSSIPACVLEWAGQWSVTPRRITERLSVSSSFHNVMERPRGRARTLKMLTHKAGGGQHPLERAIRETVFKLQNLAFGGDARDSKGKFLNANSIIPVRVSIGRTLIEWDGLFPPFGDGPEPDVGLTLMATP